MPEVDIDAHPLLAPLNSSASEQFNAWFKLFLPVARKMRAEAFNCFTILLAVLWNEHRAGKQAASFQPVLPRPAESGSLLKRRRG